MLNFLIFFHNYQSLLVNKESNCSFVYFLVNKLELFDLDTFRIEKELFSNDDEVIKEPKKVSPTKRRKKTTNE